MPEYCLILGIHSSLNEPSTTGILPNFENEIMQEICFCLQMATRSKWMQFNFVEVIVMIALSAYNSRECRHCESNNHSKLFYFSQLINITIQNCSNSHNQYIYSNILRHCTQVKLSSSTHGGSFVSSFTDGQTCKLICYCNCNNYYDNII